MGWNQFRPKPAQPHLQRKRCRPRVGVLLCIFAFVRFFCDAIALYYSGLSGEQQHGLSLASSTVPLLVGVTVDIPSVASCGEGQEVTRESLNFVPSGTSRIVGGFPATPILGNGFLDNAEGDHFSSVLFAGRGSKFLNGPILSTGSCLVVGDDSPHEYRMMYLKTSINYTAIRKDEAVESDVCVTIVPGSKQNSVSSGEEVFCTHEHYFGGDELAASGIETPITFDFGPSGFRIPPAYELIIGSVSQIFTNQYFVKLEMEEVRRRDAPPKPVEVQGIGMVETSLDLLALHFEVLLVPSTNERVSKSPPLRSVRSPMRDRSFFPMPNTEVFPLTIYKNVMTESSVPITLRGLGIFRSMLDHYIAGHTVVTLFVNGEEVVNMCLASHLPGRSSTRFEAILPLDVTIPPNCTVRVENTLAAYIPGSSVFTPTPYDFAVYLLYEHPDLSNDALKPVDEVPLGNGNVDLNNDGHPDYVDYDTHGHIWVEMTSADGSHDTQHVPVETLITKRGKFDSVTTEWLWSYDKTTKLPYVKIVDTVESICFYLKAIKASNATFEYCDETAVEFVDLGSAPFACVGDFDGDGFFDRLRLASANGRIHMLYFAKGDGARYVSEKLVATVLMDCDDDKPRMFSTYRYSTERHAFGYFTNCRGGEWRSIDASSLLL